MIKNLEEIIKDYSLHKGKTAFVVGNGPSKWNFCIPDLQKKGLILGCNLAFKGYPPRYRRHPVDILGFMDDITVKDCFNGFHYGKVTHIDNLLYYFNLTHVQVDAKKGTTYVYHWDQVEGVEKEPCTEEEQQRQINAVENAKKLPGGLQPGPMKDKIKERVLYRVTPPYFPTKSPNHILRGNQGFINLQVAYLIGCNPIVLVGCDCEDPNDRFKRIGKPGGSLSKYDEFRFQFTEGIKYVQWEGREVYKLGPYGTLDVPVIEVKDL